MLPGHSRYSWGDGNCSEVGVAIASPNWRIRPGDIFEISAVHLIPLDGTLRYSWTVENGTIISGQNSWSIRIKAGRARTPGYLNISGFVAIQLRVEKVLEGATCSVETSHRVMIGRHREVNQFASVNDVSLDEVSLVRECGPGRRPFEGQKISEDMIVAVTTDAVDPENDVLSYNYFVNAGKIIGRGSRVQWDLTDAPPGTYKILVGVDDGSGMLGRAVSKEVTVSVCNTCGLIECPTISITGPDKLTGEDVFTANVSGGSQESVTYEWSVTNGEILEGQGTPSVTVRMDFASSITVKIGGLEGGSCFDTETTEFESGVAKPQPKR